ncbi:preprotein translocase subunit SecD [Ehrlichia ruminantium]|uniref:Protein translocase subunit SecD n=2 Tax=Ehrlichia ruminantium TaxID=779 RepID=A0A0H3M0Z2_EHRRW|nr:protein translocase subunit SecD [Ehrlichia ruminantium]CAI27391.1 Protein-export membrane protein secD [Ehrlichia ruminantium str. Welgevonden]QLK53697.1 protein translocase subunit SecD [Ehrlichia ruminantium]QLK54609.1 protein translocase subunit SecD [Ehrlichia ruminantium]QLK55533.1 protein translocase subunit SecD [Ehrlichia ruminantium]
MYDMLFKLEIKPIVVTLLCTIAIYLVLPNFIDNKFLISNKKVNLGLDLQGGVYLLLEADFKEYLKERMYGLYDEVNEFLLSKNIKYKSFDVYEDKLVLILKDSQDFDRIKSFNDKNVRISKQDVRIVMSFYDSYKENLLKNIITDSISNIRRRLDKSGTKEITINSHGKDRISLQIPGIHDTSQIKMLLGKTAKLTFHLLENVTQISSINPLTTVLLKDVRGNTYPILRKVEISGDSLVDVSSGINSLGNVVVNFKLNNAAAKKFAKITKENFNKPFAIVLDGVVLTAPVIRDPILTGSGEISGNFTVESAKELSILLKSGALPAPLKVIEEKTIGSSLGAEYIKQGRLAMIVSVVAVSTFIIFFYGIFGLLAVIGLVFNIIFIVAALTLLQATLTLPGIAGITLTVGMSVDANVLIFERIKEELRSKKKLRWAVESGFKNAMSTIFDSNITTLIVAAIMFVMGSGPVSGFAITLSIGILCSMFSAITLTKMLIDLYIRFFNLKVLNI